MAFKAGKKRFDYAANGLELPQTVTTDYRVWCRQELQREFQRLSEADQKRVTEYLAPHGGVEALFADGEIDAGMDEDLTIPFPERAPQSLFTLLKIWAFGTARNVPK